MTTREALAYELINKGAGPGLVALIANLELDPDDPLAAPLKEWLDSERGVGGTMPPEISKAILQRVHGHLLPS